MVTADLDTGNNNATQSLQQVLRKCKRLIANAGGVRFDSNGKRSEMAARMESVAKYICERTGWKKSNLELQKLMYLAQMFHMGRNNGVRLFDGEFEAWDYGPVEPDLYHRAKIFGADPVRDIFHSALTFKQADPRRRVMDDVCAKFGKYSGGDLVEITHWDEGAWARNYVPRKRHIAIPDEQIWEEYQTRQRRARERRS